MSERQVMLRVRRAARGVMPYLPLIVLVAAGLALRLLVWRWHRQYPLGGDESEYFNQALTLLREHRYVELKLMRPPLYTGFLAVCIYLFDSLVQRLRLIQAIISALTVVPVYALARQLFGDRRVALVAALLAAASYTLAANATELLTETLFLLGLTVLFWLLKAGTTTSDRAARRLACAALAGLTLGALVLLRSVALPLLPLGALWLLLNRPTSGPNVIREEIRRDAKRKYADSFTTKTPRHQGLVSWCLGSKSLVGQRAVGRWLAAVSFVLGCALVVLPWTLRNAAIYGAPILVDTTGPENLWLDNDPAGRDAVKQQLYALGDDRAMRQRIALARGVAAIADDPGRFLDKSWGEAKKFFALQYFDDLRERRAIWVPPAEVWLRLLLGDGIWLVLLLAGVAGLWLAPAGDQRWPAFADPRWLFVPWALYTLLTAVVFHVELRYRLPLYPVLLPYAAWTLTRLSTTRAPVKNPDYTIHEGHEAHEEHFHMRLSDLRVLRGFRRAGRRSPRAYAAGLTVLLLSGLLLLHRPYISETRMLAWKHARLWQAERALATNDPSAARTFARAALDWDGDSALAQVALARAALEDGDQLDALAALDAAQSALPAHPYAHLLRGAVLRAQGQDQAARPELAYETASLEDLQGWAWNTFAPVLRAPAAVDLGGGLDLGAIGGFSAAETGGFRWSSASSRIMLVAPGGPAQLELSLAPGRPAGVPRPTAVLLLNGRELRRIAFEDGWHTYSVLIDQPAGPLVLTLRSDTFRPRDYDRASPDDRALGVMVKHAQIKPL